MFDLKFIDDVKYILDISEQGIKIEDTVVVNKKQAERIDEENDKKLRYIDSAFGMWVYNRYITKTKKNKYLIGGRGTMLSTFSFDCPVMKY